MQVFRLPLRPRLFGMQALYLAISLMIAGNTLQSILLLSRASVENFSATATGLMTATYYIGWMIGCIWVPQVLVGIGHIRIFTALASLASSLVIGHVLMVDEAIWIGFRLVSGFCMAGLFIVVESWLCEMAPAGQKARAFSIYRVLDIVATTAGQFLLMVAEVDDFRIYGLISILLSLSLIPIALSRAETPVVPIMKSLNLRRLYHNSPQGMIGVFITGMCFGGYWGFAPSTIYDLTGSAHDVPIFLSVFCIGGFFAQYLIGPIADRLNTRTILNSYVLFSVLLFIICLSIRDAGELGLNLASFFAGISIMPLYSLCVAHANDRSEAADFVEVSSGLLVAYGCGAALGPLLAAATYRFFAAETIFLMPLIFLSFFALVSLRRTIASDPVPLDSQGDFVALSRNTVSLELAPRSEDDN